MLATVRGTVASAGVADVVIDVHGIGFAISVPQDTALSLRVGDEATLHTVLIPREDEWTLYGFATTTAKELFQLVRSVTGVGPRTALAVLSTLTEEQIAAAVAEADATAFTRVPGIGAKTANLIVVSLTGKAPRRDSDNTNDLAESLTGLGWPRDAARDVARQVTQEHPDGALSEQIRFALRLLGGER